MFSRLSTAVTVSTFAMLASASIVARTNPPTTPPCNPGSVQCCNSVQEDYNNPVVQTLAGLLNVVVGPLDALFGLTCTTVLGDAGCSQQTVCCTGNNFSGVLVLGCSPVTLNV